MSILGTAVLKLDRVTTGAVLYKNVEEADGQPVTTIYLRKSGLPPTPPTEIRLTIDIDD